MKKYLLLLFISTFAMAQVNPTSFVKIKVTGATKNNNATRMVVEDSITKERQWILKSSINTNLDKIVTPTDITVLSSTGNDVVLPLVTGINAGLMIPADKTKLDSQSGTNTGDQDISGKENLINKATDFTTINNALYPSVQAVKTQLDLKTTANTAITGATNTKITYDSKGLVTAGTSATTADIADTTNKRYQTDAQQTNNDATSSIQTQLNGKQASLGFTAENIANKSDSYTTSSSTTYASTKAVVDGLATKQPLENQRLSTSSNVAFNSISLKYATSDDWSLGEGYAAGRHFNLYNSSTGNVDLSVRRDTGRMLFGSTIEDGAGAKFQFTGTSTFSSDVTVNGTLGLRNVANTFTSYLINTNTASRTYTLQNRNGILADDTDLALKANLAGSSTFTDNSAGLIRTTFNNTNNTSASDRDIAITADNKSAYFGVRNSSSSLDLDNRTFYPLTIRNGSDGTWTNFKFAQNGLEINNINNTVNPIILKKSGVDKFTVSDLGVNTAASFIKTGGTSSQFLKADGSVDSSTYIAGTLTKGTATLVGGTVTVNTSAALTGSIILVSLNTPGGTLGIAYATPSASIVNATSFVINSVSAAGVLVATDTSTINWQIIN